MLKKYLPKIALGLLIIAIVALIALGILVHYHSVFKLDLFLSRDLQGEGDTPERKALILNFLLFVSFFGKAFVTAAMVFITAAIFYLYKFYREVIFIIITPIAAGVNALVKLIVDRPRPSDNLISIIDRELDPSFPSGHVNFYVVFFGLLIAIMLSQQKIPLIFRFLSIGFSLIMIVSVSFSRIYLGAHWATDVLGGYLLGFILLSILLYFYFRPTSR